MNYKLLKENVCLEFRVTLYRRQPLNGWSRAGYKNATIHLSDHWVLGQVSSQDLFVVQFGGPSALGRGYLFQTYCISEWWRPVCSFRAVEVFFIPQVSASAPWCLWAAEQFFWPHGSLLWCALSAVTHLKVDQEKWRAPAAKIHMSLQRLQP